MIRDGKIQEGESEWEKGKGKEKEWKEREGKGVDPTKFGRKSTPLVYREARNSKLRLPGPTLHYNLDAVRLGPSSDKLNRTPKHMSEQNNHTKAVRTRVKSMSVSVLYVIMTITAKMLLHKNLNSNRIKSFGYNLSFEVEDIFNRSVKLSTDEGCCSSASI